jgi:hypothetical protein
MDEYEEDFLANYFSYRTDEPKPGYGGKTIYITPHTTPIEDKINRARLKEIYPSLTDAEIDKHLNEYRSRPSYITNKIGSWGGHDYVGPDQTYPEFNAPASYYDENRKLKGYLPDEIREDIQKYKRYIPVWGEPEEVYDVKIPKMELKKPEPIATVKGELAGTKEENLPPEYPIPFTGMDVAERKERKVNWDGTNIGYRPLKFRKPGHSGDLIKLGSKKYIKLPTIETRNVAYLTPRDPYTIQDKLIRKFSGYDPEEMEGYQEGDAYYPGEIERAQEEGRRIEFKGYRNKADKAAQEEYNRAYDEYEHKKALEKFYASQFMNPAFLMKQEGGEAGCPEGYAFNPKTGECVEWNPDIRESYDQPTSFDSIGDVIYINPDDRPEGMSDQEYQDMYNDQIEHEQLHRLQWINDELKGQNQTPLRMPSTVDNPEYGGDHYYNRRQEEEAYLHDIWNQRNPELARFIPEDVIYNNETDPVMYELPWTVEGEARGYEGALHRGMESFFPKKRDGGEKDKWGRSKGSKWYGFDPKTKKYTRKEEWGRSPDSQWYGFNPQNKSWTVAIVMIIIFLVTMKVLSIKKIDNTLNDLVNYMLYKNYVEENKNNEKEKNNVNNTNTNTNTNTNDVSLLNNSLLYNNESDDMYARF